MLSFEQFRQPQCFQRAFETETSSVESYPSNNMDNYYYSYSNNTTTAYNNNLPFDFVGLPEGLEASIDSVHEMTRSASGNSMKHISHEYATASLSSASIASASSSTPGSPYSGPVNMFSAQDNYMPSEYMTHPTIVPIFEEPYQQPEYMTSHEFAYHDSDKTSYSVDPHMLSSQYGNVTPYPQSPFPGYPNSSAPSPAASHGYSPYSHHLSDKYSTQPRPEREMSVSSQRSGASPRTSVSGDEENGEKGRCPHPECGKAFKDLKAHMLTHQSKRPEKCPIPTCEWHKKGFARKYDRNRHVLTHYKGTMVCYFCPGSGSPAENSFNRADVFKRHLTQVHGVEQTASNSKRRSPNGATKQLSGDCQSAAGKCSTCSHTFSTAQEFYDHLDDCVLRMVQKEEPSEAINKMQLSTVAADQAVQDIFDRNHIKQEDVPQPFDFNDNGDVEEEDYDEEEEEDDEEDAEGAQDRNGNNLRLPGHRAIIGGNISKKKSGKKGGMTWSKIGVSLVPKGRKRRQHYPPSWGMSADKMKMKKRVLCVYDGNRRLLKDDMMLNSEFEVRVRINEGNSYVTDLDVETLKRANAFHEAPEEERKTWFQEQDHEGLLTDLFSA